MPFVVAVYGCFVATILFLTAQHALVQYQLRKRHMESLWRVDDLLQVNLHPDAAELLSAAVKEEARDV